MWQPFTSSGNDGIQHTLTHDDYAIHDKIYMTIATTTRITRIPCVMVQASERATMRAVSRGLLKGNVTIIIIIISISLIHVER